MSLYISHDTEESEDNIKEIFHLSPAQETVVNILEIGNESFIQGNRSFSEKKITVTVMTLCYGSFGYAKCSDLSRYNLENTMREALAQASTGQEIAIERITSDDSQEKYSQRENGLYNIDESIEKIREKFSFGQKNGSYNVKTSKRFVRMKVISSLGVKRESEMHLIELQIKVEGKVRSGFFKCVVLPETLSRLETTYKRAIEHSCNSRFSDLPKLKKSKIVLAEEAFAHLLARLSFHLLSIGKAPQNIINNLGENISSSVLTITDTPIPCHSLSIDFFGRKLDEVEVISGGVLKNLATAHIPYYLSDYSTQMLDLHRASSPVEAEFHNINVKPGENSLEDLLLECDLYIPRFKKLTCLNSNNFTLLGSVHGGRTVKKGVLADTLPTFHILIDGFQLLNSLIEVAKECFSFYYPILPFGVINSPAVLVKGNFIKS